MRERYIVIVITFTGACNPEIRLNVGYPGRRVLKPPPPFVPLFQEAPSHYLGSPILPVAGPSASSSTASDTRACIASSRLVPRFDAHSPFLFSFCLSNFLTFFFFSSSFPRFRWFQRLPFPTPKCS